MRPYVILRYVGLVLIADAVFLALGAMISAWRHEVSFLPLLYSALISLLFGMFPLIFVPATKHIRNDEGLMIVISSWLLSCLAGVLPYLLYGGEFTLANAWFESVSGFTTTGASILSDVEALPMGLLFWRAATHWIGGIGIIVFVLSVLPAISQAAMVLTRSEISPLAKNNFQYRTQKTLRILLAVYVGLTLLETLLLLLCGMDLFDAVAHSFATVATGGFAIKNLSIAHYQSLAIESVIGLFMALAGIHFGLLFLAATGRFRAILNSSAVRFYIGSLAVGILLVAASLHGSTYAEWGSAFRYASFQVLSLGSSTGFASADSAGWPPFAMLVLIYLTFQCACSGSTSGGIKVERILVALKAAKAKIYRLKHPKAVAPMELENTFLSEEVLTSSLLFICCYVGIVFLSTLLLTAFGVDALTSFTGSAAAMGGVGPGFGSVSSLANYGGLPDAAKWTLSLVMLMGRLEIFGLLLFLSIRTLK